MAMKELLKLRVDRKLLSSLKKKKKDWKSYVEMLLRKDVSENRYFQLINKLTAGYNLSGFKREDVYDRH